MDTVEELFDFAVGFSRQLLPKGNRFAVVTNAGGPGIMATDAAIRHGLELAKLRPETLESLKAKLPPTAILFSVGVVRDAFPNISTAEEARAGFEKITNGVKQKLPSARLLGVEVVQMPVSFSLRPLTKVVIETLRRAVTSGRASFLLL